MNSEIKHLVIDYSVFEQEEGRSGFSWGQMNTGIKVSIISAGRLTDEQKRVARYVSSDAKIIEELSLNKKDVHTVDYGLEMLSYMFNIDPHYAALIHNDKDVLEGSGKHFRQAGRSTASLS